MADTVQRVEIRPVVSRYNREIAKATRETNKASRSIDKMGKSSKGLGNVIGIASRAFAALGLSIGAVKLIQTAARFEQLRIRLDTFSDSAEAAAIQWDILNKVAETTPFDLEQVISGFTTLRAAGLRPTRKELSSLADVAAGTGTTFNQLSAIIFKGAQSTELFQNVGVRANVIGNKIRVTYQGQTQTIDRTSRAIQAYLVNLAESTKLNGAAERASAGLTGALSNTVGNFNSLVSTIGLASGAEGTVAGSLAGVAEQFADLRLEIQETGDIADALFGKTFEDKLANAGSFAEQLAAKFNPITQAIELINFFTDSDVSSTGRGLGASAALGTQTALGIGSSGDDEIIINIRKDAEEEIEIAKKVRREKFEIQQKFFADYEALVADNAARSQDLFLNSGNQEKTLKQIISSGSPEQVIEAIQTKLSILQEGFDMELELLAEVNEEKGVMDQEAADAFAEVQQQRATAVANASAIIMKQQQLQAVQQGQFTADILGQLSGALAQFGQDNIAAFVVSKALAIAQSIVNTQVAVTQALASAPPPGNFALAASTQLKGNLSTAIIAATAVGQLAASRQTGGAVVKGRPYRVGEAGAETFIPSSNGRIARNGEGGGNTMIDNRETNINISGNVDDRSIQQIREVISSDPEFINSVATVGQEFQRGI